MKNSLYIFVVLLLAASCKSKEQKVPESNIYPIVSNHGQYITFPDKESLSFFETEQLSQASLTAELSAPAKVAATVISSGEGAGQNIILFENSENASNYTQLMQHHINIKQIQNINIRQKQLEIDRIKDLLSHGAATGQDLLIAQTELSMEQTNLANEKAALIEHEAIIISAGFTPDILRKASAGTAFLICEIPENQISLINEKSSVNILFSSFPNEKFTGKIDAFAEMVDNTSRMAKIRIRVNNSSKKFKAGMFAEVTFKLDSPTSKGSKDDLVNISNSSLVTVQGKSYVFVKKEINFSENEVETGFERKEIQIGQQIGDRIIVLNGLNKDDEIAIEGVMQLKGLSFGY
ncbi:MAG TPA: efflux RND transporter periplasmic adaptor subunit [Chitinophagales bacterium]|nr:efflux RND transporter periplasmic adaptor subunit [Chitinophagales bacterium]